MNNTFKYANEIIPNLWLGNRNSPKEIDTLKNNNIKLIINCSKNLNYDTDVNIQVVRLSINDVNSEESNQILGDQIEYLIYLVNLYLNNNCGVLIHCYAGVQRSATVVLCYLLKYKNMNLNMGKAIMKQNRSIVFFPYPTFDTFINNYAININNKN
jgi:protein-tyrosine phosphatase